MATMSDQQLDSDPVALGIEHYWHLPQWAFLGRRLSSAMRQQARMLALLTPDQLRRALEPDGIPLKGLTHTQQQRMMQLQLAQQELQEQEGSGFPSIQPAEFLEQAIRVIYVPDGWYVAYETVPFSPCYVYGGRTPEEAKAAQRRYWQRSGPQEVRRVKDGYFTCYFETVIGSR
jgi:hypothetical protein